MKTFNPLDYPISLLYPTRIARVPWTEHVPFALTLIDLVRPRMVVELGTGAGISYCAFCQAIAHLRLPARAFAVDNGPAALGDLRGFHDPLYGDFSRLVPSTFDEALAHFSDGSIDLLHLGGRREEAAVRHDFAGWLPKMSRRGVILVHGINTREANGGVCKLWHEIQGRYPSFDLLHAHGLGLAAVGPEVADGLRPLLDSTGAERLAVREYFCQLGRRIIPQGEIAAAESRLAESQARHEGHVAELRARYESQVAEVCARHQAELQEHAARARQIEADRAAALVRAQAQQTELASRLADAEQRVQVRQTRIEGIKTLLEAARSEAAALRARLLDKEAEISSLTATYQELEKLAHQLREEVVRVQGSEQRLRAALGDTQASLAWRLAHFLSRCSYTLAPRGTRRRRVLGTARRALRHSRVRGILVRATARVSQLLW